jgi:hypothetical protein
MKKNNSLFGVFFAIVAAAIFLAVTFPNTKPNHSVNSRAKTLYNNYQLI